MATLCKEYLDVSNASKVLLCRWETCIANLEEARVTFDVITRAVEDAVYLDEDAYKEIAPTMQFTKVIRVCHFSPLKDSDWEV